MRRARSLAVPAALLLAGCGGAHPRAATSIPRVEQTVKSVLERNLMTSQPRTARGTSWSTHVRRVRCATAGGNAFSCEVTFMNGARRRVTARERSNGALVVG